MKNNEQIITIIFLIFLVVVNIWMIGFGHQPWFISSLNIFFHEAGHIIFSIFGHILMVLGGTLMELVIPGLFLFYFHRKNQIPGMVFSLWWLSVAVYDVALYIGDARARMLPLIGGQEGHDWAYLLGHFGLRNFDTLFSRILIIISLCITLYMIFLIYKYYELSKGREI